ncbi:SMP-30/gluconolactonase/LRE family protein [Tamlana sp. I1]|uniref:SMP-30/gluconolactonase/LRE family protein n=1 Tax=Tamlana sp. I1 TaxID=2762061 RepID=UPI00188E121C|nr:SMP-30/gluconolactonase/LRE family protein [Tamlana sp. I1]
MKKEHFDVQPIFEYTCEHGEGPIWDCETETFYWVDLLKGRIQKGAWLTKKVDIHTIDQAVGAIALHDNNQIIIAARDGFGIYNELKHTFNLIEPSPIINNKNVRFNDGAIDPVGRFFAGTMEWNGKREKGALYRLDTDHSIHLIEERLTIPNGMGWNKANTTFYMIDTEQHCMFAYDYSMNTGALSNKRIHVQFNNNEFPDGMTIDVNDHFWIALWGGGKIVHLDEKGKKIKDIILPVPYPTSCCFGGPNLDHLLITSSRLVMSAEDILKYPLSGRNLLIKTDSKGKKRNSSRLL